MKPEHYAYSHDTAIPCVQREQDYQRRQTAKQAREENRSTDSAGASNGH